MKNVAETKFNEETLQLATALFRALQGAGAKESDRNCGHAFYQLSPQACKALPKGIKRELRQRGHVSQRHITVRVTKQLLSNGLALYTLFARGVDAKGCGATLSEAESAFVSALTA